MNPEDKDAVMGLLLKNRNRANEAGNVELRDLIDAGIAFVEVA